MANQLTLDRALDANGYIMPGAKATIYGAGTSTLIPVYSDVDGATEAANPIVADGDGFWPQRFVAAEPKVIVTDADDASVYTLDPAPVALGLGSAASEISFDPTVPLPFTNVQAAIEGAAAAAVTGFNDFGLGISGNTTLLADINATGTASGVYRWDGTSTGTFPSGISAATTGLIELNRQTASEAKQVLRSAGGLRIYVRYLAATVWGAWREIPTVTDGSARGAIMRRGATNWEHYGPGADGEVLTSDGTDSVWSSSVRLETAVSAAGQTAINFIGVPATANRVTVLFNALSTNGTASVSIQIGDTGGIEASGYASSSAHVLGASSGSNLATTSFALDFGAFDVSAAARVGSVTLQRISGDTWAASGTVGLSNSGAVLMIGGVKTLSATLDRVRITTTGADTFDAGSVTVSWG